MATTEKSWLPALTFLSLLRVGRMTYSDSIHIGGLFEHDFRNQELVFKYAVEKINARSDLLPNTRLTYDLQQTPVQDSFHASKKVCEQVESGVAAIFGPMSDLSAAHVQSICDALEIPHVETRWDFRDSYHREFYSINLFPHYRTLSQAFIDLINHYKWTSFTILYESNDGLVRLQELLKSPSDREYKVTVRRLEAPDDDFKPILKEIRSRSESRIVIDAHFTRVENILRQALQMDMMSGYYHYLLTSLDLELVDLEDFKYGGCNITAFRLVDPQDPHVQDVTSDWILEEMRTGMSPLESERGIRNVSVYYPITTETALMYDAVHLFAKALDELQKASLIRTTSLSCSKTLTWAHGNSLLNFMKMERIEGLSGTIEYDEYGVRSDFQLDLVELENDGLETIGFWNPKNGINITKDYSSVIEKIEDTLKNSTLLVTTILDDPFVMLKDDPDKVLRGNDRYEGYCVDLLSEISKMHKFNYTIKLVDDGQYGAPDKDGVWGGMVGELLSRKVDLAVASLTISYSREQVIDFTKPFMNLGISILFQKPKEKNPSLFSFLSPLSFEIWIYVIAAYLLVSFMLFVLARFSPYEWYNPHPCNADSDIVENQFTLLNSLWFTVGSLMQQGSEVAPRAISTRLVSGIWWFFTLIIISSYTANLAAFLTVERMTSPIENADDLAKQTDIKYGTIYRGSSMTFFKNSKIPTYERMWNFMDSTKPSVFVNSTKEGIERVKKGKYAYLLESTMNEYFVERNCDLMQVGGLLDSKGYGIGTPRGSPYRDILSSAILKLQEDQVLQMLYNKWWKQKGVVGNCNVDDKGKKDANALSIANVGGVFVLLLVGLALSVVVSVLEFVWKAYRRAEREKARDPYHKQPSLCSEMADELGFAMRCTGSSKKVVKRSHNHNGHQMLDNGMTLVPLTSKMTTGQNFLGKETYT